MHNAFIPKAHQPKLNKFCDKYYYDVKLVDKVKKVGEGDDDFIIVKKEVVTKTDIKEVIESQADDVGLNNILKQFALTGDTGILPKSVNATEAVIDYSSMPQDLIEVGQYYKAAQEKFDALPDDLKKGRSFSEFMSSITQEEFNAFIASKKPVEDEEKEGDK